MFHIAGGIILALFFLSIAEPLGGLAKLLFTSPGFWIVGGFLLVMLARGCMSGNG